MCDEAALVLLADLHAVASPVSCGVGQPRAA
jgi:hypothetical protein